MRASLTAGALIITSLYIIFAEQVEKVIGDDNLSSGLAFLRDYLSGGAWAILAAVAAYIIGSIFMAGRNILIRNIIAGQVSRITSDTYLDSNKYAARVVGLFAPFSRTSVRRIGTVDEKYEREIARRVCIDIILEDGARLLIANKDLYDEYDRTRAEAEFRDAVGIPGVILCLTIVGHMDLAGPRMWITAILVSALLFIALFIQGRKFDRSALSLHAHAVADGTVSTASLDAPDIQPRRRWSEPTA
jgi:hypothetical protein